MREYKEPTGRDTFERLSGAFRALEGEIQVAALHCGDDIDTRSEMLTMIPVLQGMFRRVSTEVEAVSRKEFLRANPPSAVELEELREWVFARKTPWWGLCQCTSERVGKISQEMGDALEKKRKERE